MFVNAWQHSVFKNLMFAQTVIGSKRCLLFCKMYAESILQNVYRVYVPTKSSFAGQVMVKQVNSELYIVVGTVAMSYLLHGKLSSNSSLCTFVVDPAPSQHNATGLPPAIRSCRFRSASHEAGVVRRQANA